MIEDLLWADEGWEEPVIEERFDPDRTVLSLSFKKSDDKKATIKSDDKKATIKSDDKKATITIKQQEQILKTHHVFTHIRWDMEVYAAELSGDISGGEFGWFTPDQIRKDVMMPTAFKKISQVLLKIEGDKETD